MSDIPICELKGHDILAVERFQDGTTRMIEFVVRKDGTPYGHKLRFIVAHKHSGSQSMRIAFE